MIQQPCVRRPAGARPALGVSAAFVAFFVLVGLVAVTISGCGRSAGDDTPAGQDQPAVAPPSATPAGGALSASATEMLAWLPGDNAVPGWVRATSPRHFGPASLWEYINGAAESYLAFDFQELLTLDFAHAAHGLRVTVDLYRMASPLGAFGIYAQETNPAAEFLSVGAEGQLSGTAASLWSGSAYVKLTSGDRHAELAPGQRAQAADNRPRHCGPPPRPAGIGRIP
jgi:hypothetical protein